MDTDKATLRDRTTSSQRWQHQILVDIERQQPRKRKQKRRRRQDRRRQTILNVFNIQWKEYATSSFFPARIKLIAILVAILILLRYFSKSSSRLFFATTATIKNTPQKDSSSSSCPPYGCPSYPLNYGDASVQTYIQNIEHFISKNGLYGVYNQGMNSVSMTRETNSGHVNQDRAVVIQPFLGDDNFLAAIFDGHGDFGHKVAEYAQKELPNVMFQKLTSIFHEVDDINGLGREEEIKRALIETFVQVDRTAPADVSTESGCTASVVLKLYQTIYVANTGDSRSFIATVTMNDNNDANHNDYNIQVPYISRRDKPNLPDEKSRIESMGGKIFTPKPPKPPSLSRVVVFSPTKKEKIALAMSRSLGDGMWTQIGVIPDPIVDALHIDDLVPKKKDGSNVEFMAVVGSDGIFDSRTKEFVSKHIAASLFFKGDHPLVMSNKLIELASPNKEEWYRDDITFAAVKFRL